MLVDNWRADSRWVDESDGEHRDTPRLSDLSKQFHVVGVVVVGEVDHAGIRSSVVAWQFKVLLAL